MGPVIRREVAVSLVVPIYNEQEVLDDLHSSVSAVLDDIGEPWEIVYVNDGSDDSSLEKLLGYQSADPRVTVVELSRNWGHQPALSAGLRVARGDAVVLMDGDFQDPPEVIAKFVKAWREGAQVVVAQRRTRKERGFRRIAYPLFYRFMGFLSDFPIPLNAGIFGLLDRQVVDSINALTESNRYLPGLRAWVGYKTEVVFYDRHDRAAGRPKQTFWRLLKYALDAIFSFSYKPLRLSLVMGMGTACVAMLYGIFILVTRLAGVQLTGPFVWGYTSTIVSVLFMGGIQLISLGILGEYIGRIYDEVKKRPLYVIRQVHSGAESMRVATAGATEGSAAESMSVVPIKAA
jgi:glycosyltransferase involved in cell wall biosynthesis